MRRAWREVVAALLPAALIALWALAASGIVALTLSVPQRETIYAIVEPRLALVLLTWLVFAGALGAALRWAWLRLVVAPARLVEQAQIVLGGAGREIDAVGSADNRALARAINTLVRERAELKVDIGRQVSEASREIEQERSRLAALMSELTQSVVVCNLDGRIILYNSRARAQFRALSQAPTLVGGAELIGLGRSIYAVLDAKLVAHALETVHQRVLGGSASPSAQFVTSTPGGQLLRVQLAPVRAIESEALLNGFVLMLDNITRDFADESLRDQLLHGLTEGTRASLGNLQAAVEMLDYDDVDTETRERFHAVIRDEVRAMSQRMQSLASHTVQTQKTRWPLEDMLGADLVSAALRRIEALYGCAVAADDVDASLWLRVDSYSLLQALAALAGRLVEEYEVRRVQLRLRGAGNERAHLDLVWAGQAMSTETVMSWETDALKVGTDSSALTVRDVVERHGGAFWFERERVRHEAFFRFLLPLASMQEDWAASPQAQAAGRPEYYDFDLFKTSAQADELADSALADLTYTVFDTETTGLDPSAGDEIIQIGAARIVAGKLRRHDSFEQLVDPDRPISAASIPIHGITDDMVAGKPGIAAVLPAFHAFAHDTVLVAHNAAFDMRFLQLKEAATGVAFRQPVLDTLLLSALVHPNQESHRLEDIAARFDVAVLGRHTALGDAMVTAEVFLRMIPLLAEKGIRTLGQAREAAQKTYFARVKY
jgi:DNA polymerase-3 subunit epsilon